MEVTLEAYAVESAAEILTPALLIYPDIVRANIAAAIALMGKDPARWRPHIKTVKSPDVIGMLQDAGVQAFKCATTLELAVCLAAGVRDILVAMPISARAASRISDLATHYPAARVSVLVEAEAQLRLALQENLSVFIDVNSGMDRTGVAPGRSSEIRALADTAGKLFRGLHYYDGHISGAIADREKQAQQGYGELLQLVHELGSPVEEVITSGTPAVLAGVHFAPFQNGVFKHRVSPGTVVFNDLNSLGLLPGLGFAPAALVLASVVSHPAPGILTCDAGHKSLTVDSGVPNCRVLGWPGLEPLKPSEEHLPIRVTEGSATPAIGEMLYLLPKHICPTVNLFDQAITVRQGKVGELWPIAARGHELRIG